MAKLEIMHMLQASADVSAHTQGCPIKQWNGKLAMRQKSAKSSKLKQDSFEIWLR